MKRKMIALIISALLTVSLLPMVIFAEDMVADISSENQIILGEQVLEFFNTYSVETQVIGDFKTISVSVTNSSIKLTEVSGIGFTFRNGVMSSSEAHSIPDTSTLYTSVQLEVDSEEAANRALNSILYVGAYESGSKIEISGSTVELQPGDYYLNGHFYTLSESGSMSWDKAMEWAFNLQTTDSTRYPGFKSYPVVITSIEENLMLTNVWYNDGQSTKRQIFLPAVPRKIVKGSGSITVGGTEGNRTVTVTGEPNNEELLHYSELGHGETYIWLTGTPEEGQPLPNETGKVTYNSPGDYWASGNPDSGGMVYFGHPNQGAYWDNLSVKSTWNFNVWTDPPGKTRSGYDKFTGHVYGMAEWEGPGDVRASKNLQCIEPELAGTDYDGVYDGQTHGTAAVCNMIQYGTIEYSIDGGTTWAEDVPQIKDVGTINVQARSTDVTGYMLFCDYSLTVRKAPLTITTGGATKKYDGEELTAPGSLLGLVNGEEVTFYTSGKITDVGICKNTYIIAWDKTAKKDNYEIKEENTGTLEVTKRFIIIESDSASKIYDGKALTKETMAVSGDGFIEGEGADYIFTGSQTEIGSSENTFTYTLNYKTKAANYDISLKFGTLVVKAPSDVPDTDDVNLPGLYIIIGIIAIATAGIFMIKRKRIR